MTPPGDLRGPTLALEFLHPTYRARSSFRTSGDAAIDGLRTWKIDYTERVRPSLIRGIGDATGWRAAAPGSSRLKAWC